jgi:hypothetical protein
MAGSNFLENLKKAVDTGEFNSEAAKKIIEIDKLADEKLSTMTKSGEVLDDSKLAESITDRVKLGGVKTVSEEEALALNSEYEKKMEDIKKQDAENKRIAEVMNVVDKQLATLEEIEEMVNANIKDMLSFTNELKEKFGKEFEAKDPLFADLLAKVNQINMKYNNSIINN